IGQALAPEEERRLLEETERRDSACHTATVLALNTSMGKKEIRTLTWERVDFEGRTVKVGKSKNEFRTGRVIPLNPAAFEALVKWAGRFPMPSRLITCSLGARMAESLPPARPPHDVLRGSRHAS